MYLLFLELCLGYTCLSDAPLSPHCLQNINARKPWIRTAVLQPQRSLYARRDGEALARLRPGLRLLTNQLLSGFY